MRAILTEKRSFKGKDGRSWVVANGVSSNGAPVRIFVEESEWEDFGIPDKAVMSDEDRESMFANAETVVTVDYDDRGRVVDAGVEK